MPAQFHRGALEAIGGEAQQVLADRHRSGEADLADDGRRDQVAAYGVGHAVNDLKHAWRQPGVRKAAREHPGAAGRFLGRLGDDAAPGGERGGDFLGEQIDREVPRAERSGLRDHDRALPGRAHEDAAIGTARFLGIPVEHRCACDHFAARLAQWFALFDGQRARDRIGALAQQRRCLAQDAAACFHIGRAPQYESTLGSGERFVEVGGAGVRHQRDRVPGRGIDDRACIAALANAPAAIDEKREVGGIVGHVMAFV